MTRLIDADEFIEALEDLYRHAGWDRREIHFSLADTICNLDMMPTVEAIPVEWIKKWMEWQNSWNLEGVITLMRDWNEREEETERTCYNCKHGAFGFDGDLGCSLWHRGIYDQKICGCWEGFERKEE